MSYQPTKWKAICDVCGFEYYSSDLKKRWDGLMVCTSDFEFDHPQKFLRVKADKISTDWVRSPPTDDFLTVCYLWAKGAYTDLGTVDCMVVDNTTQSYSFLYSLYTAGTV